MNRFRLLSWQFAPIVITFLASAFALAQVSANGAAVAETTDHLHPYAYKINGIFSIDNVHYACSGPSIQHALADAVAAGGGTVDARGCPTLTSDFASETAVGDSSHSSSVVLLLPNAGHWTSHIVNPTSYMLRLYSAGVAISNGGVGEGNPFVWGIDSGSSVDSVCGNDPSNPYYHLEGFQCFADAGSRVANAVLHIYNAEDESITTKMVALSKSADTSKIVWFHGSCCTASMTYINAETDAIGSGVPCYFGPSNYNVTAANFSCLHPNAGTNNVVVQQSVSQYSNYYGPIYMEWSKGFSDATTPGVAVTGSSAVMDFIEPKCGSDGVIGSTSRYCVTIGSGTTIHLYRPQSSNTSRYLVEDNNIGQSVILKFAGATIPDYSGEPLPMRVRSPLIPVDPKPDTTVSRQSGCSTSECDDARGEFTRSSGSFKKVERRISTGSLTVTAANNVGCIDAKATASGAEPGSRVLVSAIAPQKNTQWSAFADETGIVDIRVCTIAPITGIPVTYRWSVLP